MLLMMTFSPSVRQTNIEQMKARQFDIVVIGGGITGAGIARDACFRGLVVALVEKDDFASGTSSKTARMIHGGLRYLEQCQFKVVIDSCMERHTWHRIAPVLVRPNAFTFPAYGDSRNTLLKIRLGMWLYELMALFRNFRRHRIISSQETVALEPALARQGLVGAAHYYDGLANDARLTLATIRSAHQNGALIANHVEVTDLILEGGKVGGIKAVDRLTREPLHVRVRVVINATGPWADRIRWMEDPRIRRLIRPNRGSHLVFPRTKLAIRDVVAFASMDGQRVMYAVPWGDTCIVGTTDADHEGDLDNLSISPTEAALILESANLAFPEANLTHNDVISSFAGLRPLVESEGRAAYRISRDHIIVESDAGLITIAGGKMTTYRKMAEEVVDLVARKLTAEFGIRPRRGCQTSQVGLAEFAAEPDHELARMIERYPQVNPDILAHLVSNYGLAASSVLELAGDDTGMIERIMPDLPFIWAEVPYAVEHEMALTLSDFLIQRTYIIHQAHDQGLKCASDVAKLMAGFLRWDLAEIGRQLEQYHAAVALTRAFREPEMHTTAQ